MYMIFLVILVIVTCPLHAQAKIRTGPCYPPPVCDCPYDIGRYRSDVEYPSRNKDIDVCTEMYLSIPDRVPCDCKFILTPEAQKHRDDERKELEEALKLAAISNGTMFSLPGHLIRLVGQYDNDELMLNPSY